MVQIIFDPQELQIMEKAFEGHGNLVNVNAAYDQQIRDTVRALHSRDYLKVYGDFEIAITDAGQAALNQFHQAEKEKSKHEAEAKRKEREQKIITSITLFVGIATLIVSIINLFK